MASWPTGFLVVRLDGTCKEFSKAAMAAGWLDDGTGWGSLPFSYAHPPKTTKTLWSQSWEGSRADLNIVKVPSPLGGLAFDTDTWTSHLARTMADDALSRSLDITVAYWVCPRYVRHTSMWLGGAWSWHFIGEQFNREIWQTTPPPTVNFIGVTGLDDAMTDCQNEDWFLVVQRGNTLANTLTQDVYRLRDGHHQQVVAVLSDCDARLLAEEPAAGRYFEEASMRAMAFGSGYWWGNTGSSFVDRMGTWTRTLTDEEVTRLWGLGFGWEPN
jgi:hypothetical protein